MSLPAPWNHIEPYLQSIQDFDLGAQRLADFFQGKEEKYPPDELLKIFLTANPPQKLFERLLFCLFNIGVPDRQIGTRALQVSRLKRLWLRFHQNVALSEMEMDLINRTAGLFEIDAPNRDKNLAALRKSFQRLINAEPVTESDQKSLAILIGAEAEALRIRVNWLSENTDPYNMATMARILPRLRIYDEAVHEGLDLAKRQEQSLPVGLKILSFEAHLHASGFKKWLNKIASAPSLEKLGSLVQIQREKKIPTLDLIALCTLCRWTWEAVGEKSGPLDWISKALDSYHDGEFAVEAGKASRILVPALSGTGAKSKGTMLIGDFGIKSFPTWIGRDLLTLGYLKATDDGTLNIKAVLTQNITRDSILEALLGNPKVFQTPGLVSFIAATSRSLAILSKIAKSRDLVGGFANRDVPLTLLQSPCNIPISLLRPLINVRHVSLMDLKNLARAKAGVRREISDECEAYLKARG